MCTVLVVGAEVEFRKMVVLFKVEQKRSFGVLFCIELTGKLFVVKTELILLLDDVGTFTCLSTGRSK